MRRRGEEWEGGGRSDTLCHLQLLNKVIARSTFSLSGSVAAGRSQATGRIGDGPGSH